MAEVAVNELVAQALKEAGVPERSIELPPETQTKDGLPPINTTPKAVVGEELEDEKTPSTESSKSKSPESESKPLTKADLEALLEQSSRKFQSITDKSIARMQQQVQAVSNTLSSFVQSKEDAEFNSLPEDEQLKRRLERLEKGKQVNPAQPISQQPVQFIDHLVKFVDVVGLKVDDSRIDWGKDETDFNAGYQKFLTSVKAALMEDTKKAIEGVRLENSKELTKLRKKLGIDKVSVSGSSGKGTPNVDALTPGEKIKYGFELERQQSQLQQ